jgi:uncharacterized SAM-binding protein YcdF (DUF218 family)
MAVPYDLSKLVIFAVSPLGTALVLGVLGLVMRGFTRERGAQRACTALVVLALGWLWLWSTPAVSDWLRQRVEAPYPGLRAEALPRADAIVVLGGAMSPPTSIDPSPNLSDAADRVWVAARVFKAGKAPIVLASGGSSPGFVPEAESMRMLLADLGVPADRVLLESRSRTTRENAEFSAPLLRQRKVRTILLVTSALHMRRATLEFERIGMKVIPAATDYGHPEPPGLERWQPRADALDVSGKAMKEVVGAWAVQLRGAGTPARAAEGPSH